MYNEGVCMHARVYACVHSNTLIVPRAPETSVYVWGTYGYSIWDVHPSRLEIQLNLFRRVYEKGIIF